MERIELGPMEGVWDPSLRILDMRFAPHTVLDAAFGAAYLQIVERLSGPDRQPVGILVDAGNVRTATADYRAQHAQWMSANPDIIRYAVYNVSPFIRVMINVFVRGARVDVRVYADRERARAALLAPRAEVFSR